MDNVNIDQLVISPLNIRKNVDTDSPEFKEFVENVSVHGVRQPLEVRPTGKTVNGRPQYEILAGQRRYLAAIAVGITKVSVIKRSDKDDADAILTSATENIHRKDPTLLDYANLAKQLMSLKDASGTPRFREQKDVAAFLNVSPARVSAWLATADLPEQVKDLAEKGQLKMKAVESIAQSFDTAEEQEEVAGIIAEADLSSDEQVSAVREIKKNRNIVKDKDAPAKVRERVRQEKPRFSEKEREDLIALCGRLACEDEIETIREFDPVKDLSEFLALRDRLQAEAAKLVEEHYEEQRAAEEARAAQITPNEDAIAAVPTTAGDSAAFLALDQDVESVIVLATLTSRGLIPVEWVPSAALRKTIVKELQQVLQKEAGVVDLASLPVESARELVPEETHALREDVGTSF